MKKIMFLCTGNTCRSAMAAAYMKKRVKEEKLPIEVYSSGLYAQNGEGASTLAIEAMKPYQVDLTEHRATNTRDAKIYEMDIILCATLAHKELLGQTIPGTREKSYTIKEYAYGMQSENKDIRDPWGYDQKTYQNCAEEIVQVVEKIIEKEKKELDENQK